MNCLAIQTILPVGSSGGRVGPCVQFLRRPTTSPTSSCLTWWSFCRLVFHIAFTMSGPVAIRHTRSQDGWQQQPSCEKRCLMLTFLVILVQSLISAAAASKFSEEWRVRINGWILYLVLPLSLAVWNLCNTCQNFMWHLWRLINKLTLGLSVCWRSLVYGTQYA